MSKSRRTLTFSEITYVENTLLNDSSEIKYAKHTLSKLFSEIKQHTAVNYTYVIKYVKNPS